MRILDREDGTLVGTNLLDLIHPDDRPADLFSLARPDGSTLGTRSTSCTASGFLEPLTIDQTGQWRIVVDPRSVSRTRSKSTTVEPGVEDGYTLPK